MESSGTRTRGPNKQTPWSRDPGDGVSVLRLALDTSDGQQRARIEAMFERAYWVRRALQRDARQRARAYWAAKHERANGPAAVRERLGLSRTALEHAAYAHVDAAPHLRQFVTKALAMHLADSVWTATVEISIQRRLPFNMYPKLLKQIPATPRSIASHCSRSGRNGGNAPVA